MMNETDGLTYIETQNGKHAVNQRYFEVGDLVIYQRGLTCFRFKIEVIRQQYTLENSHGYIGYSSVWVPGLNKWVRENELIFAE
jgi:hypothetical protein